MWFIYIYVPRASKTQKIVDSIQKKIKKNRVFVKNPYFGFGWVCTNLSKSGGSVSNFCFAACSNFILTSSEICQTEHTIETETNVITHDAHILHRLQLPPMLRTFPSAGLGVVKKSLIIYIIYMAFQKSAFQMWTQQIDNSSDHLRCFLFVWIGQLPVPSCKTTSGASKLDAAAVHSQKQKKHIFWIQVGMDTKWV